MTQLRSFGAVSDNPWRRAGIKTALIVQGGYPGHYPREVAEILAGILRQEHFVVEISDTLDVFLDTEKLNRTDLIVPVWTVGTITEEQLNNLLNAVAGGTGLAGLHGGIVDAFRGEIRYQGMVGGQFVAHPGDAGVTYVVYMTDPHNPLVSGIGNFVVTSEQYYLLVDPSIQVLAVTRFDCVQPPLVWRPVTMPAAWWKMYGRGRVYVLTLGHAPETVLIPQVTEMIRRGMVWAAR
ncbi:ThuA domain-containing protein [Paenibacillus prosopidis]|uniref:ThuA-like domain-containing protein n=1 Tax=Paenibacillus prosopidis TaxID=630520 RepID=A0A368VND0_9BACL|nr:ThuA domain-containing protein [Paenibacillus prosopidis]RCW42495.1 hypothetical protein DFP97_11657 [Paenibacillus prosopidis]